MDIKKCTKPKWILKKSPTYLIGLLKSLSLMAYLDKDSIVSVILLRFEISSSTTLAKSDF